MKISGVYRIMNTITGDYYIGSSNDLDRRKEKENAEPRKYSIPKDLLGLWENTICEIRGEIKAQDTPTLIYAKELCDKLERGTM